MQAAYFVKILDELEAVVIEKDRFDKILDAWADDYAQWQRRCAAARETGKVQVAQLTTQLEEKVKEAASKARAERDQLQAQLAAAQQAAAAAGAQPELRALDAWTTTLEEAKAETEAQLVAWSASVEYLYEEAKAGCEKLVDGMDAAEATAVVAANATCKAKLAECRAAGEAELQDVRAAVEARLTSLENKEAESLP